MSQMLHLVSVAERGFFVIVIFIIIIIASQNEYDYDHDYEYEAKKALPQRQPLTRTIHLKRLEQGIDSRHKTAQYQERRNQG